MSSMLLNSVILVLLETLEAALMVSVLMAISYHQSSRTIWLPFGLLAGVLLSLFYASQMGAISEWFDYVGQEVLNAILLIVNTLLIVVCTWIFFGNRRSYVTGTPEHNHFAALFTFCAASAVALAITREGSEVFLYLNAFFQQSEHFQAVMMGTFLGFCIGISIGTLFFYGLLSLPNGWRDKIPLVFLALFAGTMLAQAALQLTQADWISPTAPLWDSSGWISENSIAGHFLYVLAGYEATPSGIQLFAYAIGVTLVFSAGLLAKREAKMID